MLVITKPATTSVESNGRPDSEVTLRTLIAQYNNHAEPSDIYIYIYISMMKQAFLYKYL